MNVYQQIRNAEEEIDTAFSTNGLKEVGYAQAVWTLLSVAEDHDLKIREINPLPEYQLDAYVDGLLNWLSYPLRVCFKMANRGNKKLIKELNDEHYQLAQDWIKKAKDYNHFCALFPLWYRKKIDISIVENQLIVDLSSINLEYEAYNRLVRKSGYGINMRIDPNQVVDEIVRNTTFEDDRFNVNFNPKLVSRLIVLCNETFSVRYSLPGNWQFSGFNLSQFKSIYISIQALLLAWRIARLIAARKDMQSLGYSSSVWVVQKEELVNRISSYSEQPPNIVKSIFELLTFGNVGIREPDIAVQPLIDLNNGFYALSPFVWLNVDAERNLCVLLNQIDAEKEIYSNLVKDKESIQRNELENFFSFTRF